MMNHVHVQAYLLIALAGCLPYISWSHGDYDARLKHANSGIDKQPEDARAYLSRARVHAQNGQFEAADIDIVSAFRLNPTLPEIQLTQGRVMSLAGRHREAIAHFTAYIKKKPRSAQALIKRSQAYAALNDHKTAAADLDRAIKLRPRGGPDVYLMRSRACKLLKETSRAIEGLKQGIGQIGTIASLHLALVELHLSLEDHQEALATLDSLLASHPVNAAWLAKKGDILVKSGQTEVALETYQMALHTLLSLPARNRNHAASRALEVSLRGKLEALQQR